MKSLSIARGDSTRELAETLQISDKAVSKWETGRGLPDIGIIEDLARALGVAIAELLTGDCRENENTSGNMKKVHFYVCPVCGNVISSIGRGSFNCCGVLLPEQEAEKMDDHSLVVETIENEYFVTMDHVMTKEHYISFIAYVTSNNVEIIKLYPEQDISVRFRKKGHGYLYGYCNRHGLFRILI